VTDRTRVEKEKVMSRRIVALVAGIIVGAGSTYAAGVGSGPGFVEVTYIPAGAPFVASKGSSPSFGNYGFGTAVTFNVSRFIGIEGEVASMAPRRARDAVTQSFLFPVNLSKKRKRFVKSR
jgi:hypothetical protein